MAPKEKRKTIHCEPPFELQVLPNVDSVDERPDILRAREQTAGTTHHPALSTLAGTVRESAVATYVTIGT